MLPIRIVHIVAGSLIFVAGCAQDQNQKTGAVPLSPDSAVTAGSERPSTDVLPDTVSAAFHNEFPTASVTNVVQSSAENGAPIYRITFIKNAQAGSVTYFGDGKRLPGANVPDNTTPANPKGAATDRS